MLDIICIAATVVFFLVALAYVEGCEKLWTPGNWWWASWWRPVWLLTWSTPYCGPRNS